MKPSFLIIALAFFVNQSLYAQLSGFWKSSKGNNIELMKTNNGFCFFDIKGEEPIDVTRVSENSYERRFSDTDGNLVLLNYYVSDFLISVTNEMDGRLISEWTRIGDKEGTSLPKQADSKSEQTNNDNSAMIRMLESKIHTFEGRIENARSAIEKHKKEDNNNYSETYQNTERSYALLIDNCYRQISSLRQQINRLR